MYLVAVKPKPAFAPLMRRQPSRPPESKPARPSADKSRPGKICEKDDAQPTKRKSAPPRYIPSEVLERVFARGEYRGQLRAGNLASWTDGALESCARESSSSDFLALLETYRNQR